MISRKSLRSLRKVVRENRETNRRILSKKQRGNESVPKLGYKSFHRIVQDLVPPRKPDFSSVLNNIFKRFLLKIVK